MHNPDAIRLDGMTWSRQNKVGILEGEDPVPWARRFAAREETFAPFAVPAALIIAFLALAGLAAMILMMLFR